MRLLLVDDHAVVRAGFRRLLLDEFPDAQIGEATSTQEALEQVNRAEWDLVVLDLSMPGRGGLEALKELRELRKSLPVLVMTMYSEDQYAVRAFRAGASGYVTKASPVEELLGAVRKVLAGGKYVTASLAETLATRLAPGSGTPAHDTLSDRELQVLGFIGRGRTVKEIGGELNLSEKTISTYRTRVLEKLGLRTTAELVAYALRHGLAE